MLAAALRFVGLSAYPPGPHYDEAVNVIVTRTIAYGGARPFPMVENFQGREVLYYYLSVPLLALVHNSRFGLQLMGGYSNLLLVAGTIALGRAMFPGRRGWWVGAFAGVVAAISLPQVLLARQAFRAITLPTLQALAVLLLWYGLRRDRWRLLVLAGALAGGALYTYNASRLFPVWLAVAGLMLLLTSRGERRQRLRQGVIFFGVMGVVGLPLAVYAVQRPDIFLGRLYEVTGGPGEIGLIESIGRHARMFFIQGETLLRYNPRGRPYFTLPEGALLLAGLTIAAWGVWQPRTSPLTRAAYSLLLLTPLMVVPSVIATSGFPPNHMRSVAMVPFVFIVVGLGADAITHWLNDRWRAGILLALLAAGGGVTAWDYRAWVTRADLYTATDADLAAAATWARDHTVGTVYFAAQDRFHPTVQVHQLPDVRWLGTDTLFIPAGDARTLIFPRSAPPPDLWQTWLDERATAITGLPMAPDGQPAFQAYRLSAQPPPGTTPTAAVQNSHLQLARGWDGGAFPNGRVDVFTAWHILSPIPYADLTPILHMEDSLGNLIARSESFSVGTDQWQPGETLLQRSPGLRVPVGTPPGDYPLRLTWVARGTETYLPYDMGGIWARVGTLEVLRPNQFPPADDLVMDHRVEVDVNDQVRLLGYDTLPASRRPGEPLSLTLYWQGQTPDGATDIRYELHLGETQLAVTSPTLARTPTSGWLPGQLMTDRAQATIPTGLAAGVYPVDLRVDGQVIAALGEVQVVGLARVFDPPSVETEARAVFDDKIELYGYTLNTTDELQITLLWKSLQNIGLNYTVFIHIIDIENGIIINQRDQMPQSNAYPTSLWQPQEFVTDTYQMPKPDTPYEIRIGLYDSATGERLLLPDNTDTFTLDSAE